MAQLPGEARGFYTQEIRKGGRRTGFEIVTLSGKRAVLASTEIESAHKVALRRECRRFRGDRGCGAVEGQDTIVIDEIGKMELFSFVEHLKKRGDITLLYLDRTNRDRLPQRILDRITAGGRGQ